MSERYPFRYFDEGSQRWKRARFRAPLEEIRSRYPKFELLAPPWTHSGLARTIDVTQWQPTNPRS